MRSNSSPRVVLSLKEIGARRVLISKANLNAEFSFCPVWWVNGYGRQNRLRDVAGQTVGLPRASRQPLRPDRADKRKKRRVALSQSFTLFTEPRPAPSSRPSPSGSRGAAR